MKAIAIIKVPTPFSVAFVTLLILIFMAAMKYPQKEERPYTYLALGDSYTIGEKVPAEENFPGQVCRMLEEKGIPVPSLKIIAQTGWTTDELQAAIKKEKLNGSYDLVTLLIGVNNQYRGRKVDDYIQEFESLVQQAIGYAGNDASHVIVLSIPDWSITPYAAGRNRRQIATEIDEYNSANKMIAARYNVHYLDITPATRLAAGDPSLLAEDGLHPSGKEYTIWAEQVAAIFRKTYNFL